MPTTGRMMDATVEDPAVDPFSSLTGEHFARKAYAWTRGLEKVEKKSDWQCPKGEGAKRWTSKVNEKLTQRIDLDCIANNPRSIPGMDREIQQEMQRDALFTRWLDQVPDAPLTSDYLSAG